MLKRLISLLPVSRRKFDALVIVLDGIVESEANHCQIEMNIIQQMQMKKTGSKKTDKAPHDVAFN